MAIFGEETHLALGKMLSVDAGRRDGRTDMLIAIPFGFLPRGKKRNQNKNRKRQSKRAIREREINAKV